MRYVITPLEAEYGVIEQRVSTLEDFHSCPYLSANRVQKTSNDEAFMYGTAINQVCQTMLYSLDKGVDVLDLLINQYPERESMLTESATHVFSYATDNGYSIFTNEFKMTVEIEMGNVLFVLTGTADLILKKDGKFCVVDLKTSKSEWKDDDFWRKIQKILYTFLFSFYHPVDHFSYWITTKHKKGVRFQVLDYTPDNQKIAEFVSDLLQNYVKAYTTGAYPTNRINKNTGEVNSACWMCPLRKNGCHARAGKEDDLFVE